MNLCRTSQIAATQKVLACTVGVPLSYANAESFMSALLSQVRDSAPSVRWLVLQLDGIDEIDYIAAQMLMELFDRLASEGVTLILTGLSPVVVRFLEELGVFATIGHERVFSSVHAAVAGLRAKSAPIIADENVGSSSASG